MPIATRTDQTWDYILERDRIPEGASPEEAARIKAQQTVWKLSALSLADRAALMDQLGRIDPATGKFMPNTGTNTVTILRVGLKGFDNFQLDEGGGKLSQVEWKTRSSMELGRRRDVPIDAVLELIEPGDRRELADAITEGQRLSTEEKKG